MKPNSSNVCLRVWNHKKGASILPYAPPSRRHWSVGAIPKASRSSSGGLMPNFPSPLPCKNTVEISKLISFHCREATCCKINWRPSFPKVGASLGISDNPGSSKPKTAERRLASRTVALKLEPVPKGKNKNHSSKWPRTVRSTCSHSNLGREISTSSHNLFSNLALADARTPRL